MNGPIIRTSSERFGATLNCEQDDQLEVLNRSLPTDNDGEEDDILTDQNVDIERGETKIRKVGIKTRTPVVPTHTRSHTQQNGPGQTRKESVQLDGLPLFERRTKSVGLGPRAQTTVVKPKLPFDNVALNNLPPPISTLTLEVDDEDNTNVIKASAAEPSKNAKRLPSPTTTVATELEDQHDFSALVDDSERIPYYLAKRNYHLPNNSAAQDWFMWFGNNHPLFGICFHHHMHPLRLADRIVMLVTSLLVGLGATCACVLLFAENNPSLQDEVVGVDISLVQIGITQEHFGITKEMLYLYTYGSGLHAVFDLAVWHVFACAFCQPGGPMQRCDSIRKMGPKTALIACAIATGMSAGFILQRVRYEGDGVVSISGLEFCVGFLIETALALFVYTPIFGTVLFSGVLGCYRIPVLGGRPADVRMHRAWRRATIKRRENKVKKRFRKRTNSELPDDQEIEFDAAAL